MRNLLAEMARYNVTAKDIQSILAYNERTILNKLKGKSEFSVSDAIKIRDTFFP